MADEPRVIQPISFMSPPTPSEPIADDEADRFTQDLRVPSDLSFQEWVARNRPLPPMERAADPSPLLGDVPD